MKNLTSIALVFGIIALGVHFLGLAQSFLAPFVIAVILWYIIITLAEELRRLKVFKEKLPNWASQVLAVIIIMLGIGIIVAIINDNISRVGNKAGSYDQQILRKISSIYQYFSLTPPERLAESLSFVSLSSIFGGLAKNIQTSAQFIAFTFIYLLLIFLEYRTFGQKFERLLAHSKHKKQIADFLKQIKHDISTYLKIKSVASFLTGMLSYVVLQAMGVEFASFWALIIFLLNYIPTVGSIIAVLFPLAWAFVQFETQAPFVFLIVSLVSIQVLIGNVVEPKLMGNSLNLSPLVIILSLGVWGKVWGLPGMFLCVPITVIMNVILSKFESTRPISILLSEKGDVGDHVQKSHRKNK